MGECPHRQCRAARQAYQAKNRIIRALVLHQQRPVAAGIGAAQDGGVEAGRVGLGRAGENHPRQRRLRGCAHRLPMRAAISRTLDNTAFADRQHHAILPRQR